MRPSGAAEHTVFDRILRGQMPADVVYQDEWVLAFRDINPQAPTHVLVIPKRKARDLPELALRAPAEIGEFLGGVARAAAALGLEQSGYRVVINSGRHAQQSVQYLHAHILGGRQMSWPPG